MLRSTEEKPGHDAAAIERELDRILGSSYFRNSKRCQEFLRYAVHRAVAGDIAALKERVIGSEVFGRDSSYSTVDDSIVRVKANEVRKRLAQYYGAVGSPKEVQIRLPIGSYIPEFSTPPGEEIERDLPPVPPGGNVRRRLIILGGGAALLILAIALAIRLSSPSPMDDFWRPVLKAGKPVVINTGVSSAFRVTARLWRQVDGLQEPKMVQVEPGDISHAVNEFVSTNNLRSVMAISNYLRDHGVTSTFRQGTDLSLGEMRTVPVILIGHFSNPWSGQDNETRRFRFERNNGFAIRDSKNPNRAWHITNMHPKPMDKDYAIVSRILEGNSVRVTIAGMSRFGTQAAADFVVEPNSWKLVSSRLGRGWETKNLEFVLETKIVDRNPSPAVLVAWHAW